MTGKQMVKARNKLSFTQKQLGDALGLHWNSIARMERDELPIVKQTELSLRYLLLVKKRKGEKR